MGSGLSERAVFDSTVLIDSLNGVPAARFQIDKYPESVASVITLIEVMAGARDESSGEAAAAMLALFQIVGLDEGVVDQAIRIRRERRLKLPDAIILGTARYLGCQLITRNTRDFDRDDPDILVPYEL